MKKQSTAPYIVNSISELHKILSLPKPEHPMISFINLKDTRSIVPVDKNRIVFNFYSIWLEKDVSARLRYGQQYFDFEEGSMIFVAPGQILSTRGGQHSSSGWGITFHPDFIQRYPLAKNIKEYGYFSYAVNEALHLSVKEEFMITELVKRIDHEYRSIIDNFSQDVLVSQLETLLNYCNRFYHRQFITRKNVNHDILNRMENLLAAYFESEIPQRGLPTVQYLADQLHISPNYLSDMLRNLTGMNGQQNIHRHLIERAKILLATTSFSISEISYKLGFEHAQSFNKLFKQKTQFSPLKFRQSLN